MADRLIFATRPSRLARWQTGYVISLLQQAVPDLICEEIVITTTGDKELEKPLPEIGGKGLFTQELEQALLSGQVDAAVHSLKDLPVEDTVGLIVGAIPLREDPRDVLVSPEGFSFDTLPVGALVGTSSLRRQAQVLHHRPDLRVKPIRGNVETRLRKVEEGQYQAAVMAGAGLVRLGLEDHISCWLTLSQVLPAPGQGALGVQCRENDAFTQRLISIIIDHNTTSSVVAERAFLLALGGGCSIPVGAYAETRSGMIELQGLVAATDGKRVIRVSSRGSVPRALGKELAGKALAQGAGEVLGG